MKATLLFAVLAAALTGAAEMFKDGDVVVFYGDSITHGGRYHKMIYDYYLTRFPDAKIRFCSAGISGDSAGGAQGRLGEDVAARKPTDVIVMFGMNDIGRGNYTEKPSAGQLAGQRRSLEGYGKNMTRLAARLKSEAGAPRIYYVTPSPFDDTVVMTNRQNNAYGCQAALGVCAEIVRGLWRQNGGTLVDFYTSMNAFNLCKQKRDPAYTMIGPDRIHPQQPGHLFMAWTFLKAQGADPLVSDVAVHATRGTCVKSINAEVTDVAARPDGVSFVMREKALPFPIEPAAQALAKEIPVVNDLNQEILTIQGLADGAYVLNVDGTDVGTWSAAELMRGVNLAMNEKMPTYVQAQKVQVLNERRRLTECRLRDWAAVRWFLRGRVKDLEDMTQIRAYYAAHPKGWYEAKIPGYIRDWPARAEQNAKLEAETAELFALRQPVPHRYILTRRDGASR